MVDPVCVLHVSVALLYLKVVAAVQREEIQLILSTEQDTCSDWGSLLNAFHEQRPCTMNRGIHRGQDGGTMVHHSGRGVSPGSKDLFSAPR